jgi:hypothetical protein
VKTFVLMKYTDIKRHLKPYSIVQSRRTTINHAFAAALAPFDDFEHGRVSEAIVCLEQDPADDLCCVYCDTPAETWDHLVGIVKDSELHGFGHQLGNLVPCCKTCNSRKGNKEWRRFLREQVADADVRQRREDRIGAYLNVFAQEIDLTRAQSAQADWQRYAEVKRQVLALMGEADEIATRLRITLKQETIEP